jgi:hypothetical protein
MKTTKPARPFTRRRFLRQSAATAGLVVAAPTIVPAAVLGRNGLVPPPFRPPM